MHTTASREPDSPTEADLVYAATIAERQYKQWKTEQLQTSSTTTKDARQLSRSRSPPPPCASDSCDSCTDRPSVDLTGEHWLYDFEPGKPSKLPAMLRLLQHCHPSRSPPQKL